MSLQCLEVVAKLLKGVINVTCTTFYFSDILTRPLNRILKKKNLPSWPESCALGSQHLPWLPSWLCFSFWLFNGSQALSLWGRKEVHKHLCVLFTNPEGQTKTLRQILIYLKEPTDLHAQGPKPRTLKLSKSSCLLNFSKTLPSETNNLVMLVKTSDTYRSRWGVIFALILYARPHEKKRIWATMYHYARKMRTCLAHCHPRHPASTRLVCGALGMMWLIFSPRTPSPLPDPEAYLCVAMQEICFVYPLDIGTHYCWPFFRFDTGSLSHFVLSGLCAELSKGI